MNIQTVKYHSCFKLFPLHCTGDGGEHPEVTVDLVITVTMGISPISPPERQKTELIQLIKTIILFEGCFHVLAWALFFPHLIIVLSVSREARDAK